MTTCNGCTCTLRSGQRVKVAPVWHLCKAAGGLKIALTSLASRLKCVTPKGDDSESTDVQACPVLRRFVGWVHLLVAVFGDGFVLPHDSADEQAVTIAMYVLDKNEGTTKVLNQSTGGRGAITTTGWGRQDRNNARRCDNEAIELELPTCAPNTLRHRTEAGEGSLCGLTFFWRASVEMIDGSRLNIQRLQSIGALEEGSATPQSQMENVISTRAKTTIGRLSFDLGPSLYCYGYRQTVFDKPRETSRGFGGTAPAEKQVTVLCKASQPHLEAMLQTQMAYLSATPARLSCCGKVAVSRSWSPDELGRKKWAGASQRKKYGWAIEFRLIGTQRCNHTCLIWSKVCLSTSARQGRRRHDVGGIERPAACEEADSTMGGRMNWRGTVFGCQEKDSNDIEGKLIVLEKLRPTFDFGEEQETPITPVICTPDGT
ncbi:hypothetical protein CCUS01_07892 [Colletotrichum cuscutae]|uniref:Uncharacterized protein n=1 Tax=Colletotrichum cuscutae TaxID=1209917 RepID=A0AAI9UVX4_9PEZI|nr:hypothetical protein CCUS01_07892 [Colletotrichum cuscutae]